MRLTEPVLCLPEEEGESLLPDGLYRYLIDWYVDTMAYTGEPPWVEDLIFEVREFLIERFKESFVEMESEELDALASDVYGVRDIEEMARVQYEDMIEQNFFFFNHVVSTVYHFMHFALKVEDENKGFVDDLDCLFEFADRSEAILGAQVPTFRVMNFSGKAYDTVGYLYQERREWI